MSDNCVKKVYSWAFGRGTLFTWTIKVDFPCHFGPGT